MTWDKIERRQCAEKVCAFEGQIVEMHKAIYGNGHPEEGLVWIAKENQKMIRENTTTIAEWKKFAERHAWKLICWISIGVLSAFGTFLFNLFTQHITVGVK